MASTGITAPGKGNPIELGQAAGVTGNLQMTLGTPSAYPAYAAYAGGLSWFSSGGAGIPMAAYRSDKLSSGTTGTSIKTTNTANVTGTGLFPFVSSLNPVTYTNNYQLWAGTCRAEQPPTGYDMSSVTPGSSQTQVFQTPTLQLTVKQRQLPGDSERREVHVQQHGWLVLGRVGTDDRGVESRYFGNRRVLVLRCAVRRQRDLWIRRQRLRADGDGDRLRRSQVRYEVLLGN